MSSLNTLRGRLLVQAAFTALFALMGRSASTGWTVPTVVVGVGCVFLAIAMRPEPVWQLVVTGYVGFTVAYGLLALVSGHYVPGTVLGAYTLFALVQHGAAAFAGAPVWHGPAVPSPGAAAFAAPLPTGYALPEQTSYAPPAHQPVTVPAPALLAPTAPVLSTPEAVYSAPPAYEPPAELPPSRPLAMTILPGK